MIQEEFIKHIKDYIKLNDYIEIYKNCLFIHVNEAETLFRMFNLELNKAYILDVKYIFVYEKQYITIVRNETLIISGYYKPKFEYGMGYDGVYDIEYVTHLWDIEYRYDINNLQTPDDVYGDIKYYTNYFQKVIFIKLYG